MKHIGIVAVTAEGAAMTYRHICALAMEQLGSYQHPEISLHSFSFSEHIHAGEDPRVKWADLIARSVDKLKATGADFFICPSSTPHEVYEELAPKLPLPWLHIAKATCEAAREERLQKLLLLGTRFTLESTIYDKYCEQSNIVLIRPEAPEVFTIHKYITHELVSGKISEKAVNFFHFLVNKYAVNGAEGVILGCTELPLVVSEETSRVPVLDSTIALASAAVKYALGE